MLVALFVALAASPARAERWRPPSRTDSALLLAAELAIVVDVAQSLDIKNHPPAAGCFGCGMQEMNPFLGPHPTDARLLGTAAAAMGLLAATWWWAPGNEGAWRRAMPCWVLVMEALVITRNHALGLRIPF